GGRVGAVLPCHDRGHRAAVPEVRVEAAVARVADDGVTVAAVGADAGVAGDDQLPVGLEGDAGGGGGRAAEAGDDLPAAAEAGVQGAVGAVAGQREVVGAGEIDIPGDDELAVGLAD